MRIVIHKKSTVKIKLLLFLLLILTYSLTSNDRSGTNLSMPKYVVLFLNIAYSAFLYYGTKANRRKCFLKSDYKRLFVFVSVVILYSIARSLLTFHFTFRTIQELIFLISPMLYAYFVINTWKNEDIDAALKWGLIVAFVSYIISLGMNFEEIYRALLSSNFGKSYSELESFAYGGLSLAFCLYFCYYNKSKMYTAISLLFVVMTFKRLFIIMAISLLIVSLFRIRNAKVPRALVNIGIFGLFVFAIAYYILIHPENVNMIETRYNIDISGLTMTRSDRMRWLVTSPYESYGFGSSTEYMYNNFYGALEMDASKIIIELGYIPLFLFFMSYLKYAKANAYVFIFMIFQLLNLILSSGLTGTFAWSVIFITISAITVYPEESKRA